MRGVLFLLVSLVVTVSLGQRGQVTPFQQEVIDWFQTIEGLSREEIQENYHKGTSVSEFCYLPEGRDSCAPQYIIAGSMKCGTTSLHQYLLNHPQVEPIVEGARLNGKPILANKEIRFFGPTLVQIAKKFGISDAYGMYYDLFPVMRPEDQLEHPIVTGDATPMYVCDLKSAGRAYAVLPESKIILMMRDPVDRMYSNFWFRITLSSARIPENVEETIDSFAKCGLSQMKAVDICMEVYPELMETPTREGITELKQCIDGLITNARKDRCQSPKYEGLCSPANCLQGFVWNSLYYFQSFTWLDYFGRDQVLPVSSDEFYADTPKEMIRISEFLGLEEIEWDVITSNYFNIAKRGTISGRDGVEKVSDNQQGLFIGGKKKEEGRVYPPLPEDIKNQLSPFFDKYNEALARMFEMENFWKTHE